MATRTSRDADSPAAGDLYFFGWRTITKQNDDGTLSSERVPLTEWDVLHPQEDDFIVHNDVHDDLTIYLKNVFRWRLAGQPDALVLHDHRVDWQVDDIEPHGPDLVVFRNAVPWERLRGTYPVRDQGARPILVVEVTSPATRSSDLGDKVTEYYLAGVPRYVVIDLKTRAGRPVIRLLDYRPTPEGPVQFMANDPTRIWLSELNLWIALVGDQIVCLNRDSSSIGDYGQIARQAEDAEARAAASEALLVEERERSEQERVRAQLQLERAEEERTRAETEKARAETAEQKLAELESELRRLRGN